VTHQHKYIRIRSVRKTPPDLKKLGRALIALAQAQAEEAAKEAHQASPTDELPPPPDRLSEDGGPTE
jgi:hypothetical protein